MRFKVVMRNAMFSAVLVSTLAACPLAQAADPPAQPSGGTITPIRPPAVPLIVRSPYVSIWQPSNTLTGSWATFWTGSPKGMAGIARIDDKPYVFMGSPPNIGEPMRQVSLQVTPTQSRYEMLAGGVVLSLDFLSPVEPNDLRRLSIPFGYIFAQAQSADGKSHAVSLYFDISGELASGDLKTPITWDRQRVPRRDVPLVAFTISPSNPRLLGETNDYPSWGQVVWAADPGPNGLGPNAFPDTGRDMLIRDNAPPNPTPSSFTMESGPDSEVRPAAAAHGTLDNSMDLNKPRAINDYWPVFAYNFDLGKVGPAPDRPVVLVLGHVRDPAVSYLGRAVPPLWKSYWPNWQAMLAFAFDDASAARERADRLDHQITLDATRAGGPKYAALCALALRQAFGATEMVGTNENPWMFMKEISSDGNISTVDVLYPAFPVFLYANPRLLRLQLDPLLEYAETGGWPKPFAEHDIGAAYPNASGHNNGKEEDMPVEESANMLIMVAAYMRYAPHAQAADYARLHYNILKRWADYEVQNGLDPALQNQTDDFTGFIKSSANLALKGILGVGAMGQIANYAGNTEDAAHYSGAARDMIAKWTQLAQSKTGEHLVLAYGQDDTWSLKYNAFPDKVLGLNLIPQSVLQEEAKYYTTRMNEFGAPLDNRHTYTKADWELWTAASTDDPKLRQAIVDAIYKFADTSNFRGAFTDWYDTVSGQQVGFVARPVIGGMYAILDRTALHPSP